MSDFASLKATLTKGDAAALKGLVQAALDQGLPAEAILSQGLMAGMAEIGDRMEQGDIFIPEVLLAARAMAAGLEILKPRLADASKASAGVVVIGTVQGDLHDIGKNLVATLLGGAGFKVFDLGVDVSPQKFLAEAQSKGANLVGLSALLTTTMPRMRETIQALAQAGLRDKVKVLVGGAPVTQEFAGQIGADGYAPDAGSAVRLAKTLLGV